MLAFVLVGLGGLLGSLARYGMSFILKPSGGFPWATLAVNVLGTFVIALVAGLVEKKITGLGTPEARLFFATGFCGGFTTFSALMFELAEMIRAASYAQAGLYLGASLVGGCLAFLAGYLLIRSFL